ncbi:efflux RND transporter periplasmic adaptor subunit [Thiomicrorhabdus aquaedulcis]|uniref:efflux RND transporter periplasmic adaptor subunit n=1 Tax=Thiomicrorhabdus aquaedulcis TaxID=2211106 RepID=UPI001E55DBBD|nr:efflux RND transporter periplasmic adaptor subunit [Thiomicrorhabdus aquaedulcis]
MKYTARNTQVQLFLVRRRPRSVSRMLSVALGGLLTSVLSASVFAQTVHIGALVSGQVTKVTVSEGQVVKKGDALMELDSERFQAKLGSLLAEQKRQKLALTDAKIELAQAQDLFDRTVTAKRTLDAAKLTHDMAQAAFEKAKADVAMHQAWSKYVFIKAPVDGKVLKINAPLGSTVFEENSPLLELETATQ